MEANTTHNFFRFIRYHYGNLVTAQMKKFMNSNVSLANLINKQHFLLNCRREKVYSKTRKLKNNFNIDDSIFTRLQNKFIFAIMNQEINETIAHIKKTKLELTTLQRLIEDSLPGDLAEDFFREAATSFNFHFNNVKVRQMKKFDNILLENLNEITGNLLNTSDKWLVNISNIDLPLHVRFILSLGNKFCPPVIRNKVPYFQIIADVESAIFGLSNEDRIGIRNRFVNIISNYKHTYQNLTPTEKRILTYVKRTRTFLTDNPNVMITRADKGNVTVVTLETDYKEKINDLLNDTTTYIQISKDNSIPIQTKINSLIKGWEESGNIDQNLKKKLTNYTAVIPKLYGLPKIHKVNVPYRPIVSSIGGPTYALSSYLGDILKPSVGNSFSFIKNSEHFRSKIKNIIIPSDFIIISLDVTSLFTNIDSKTVINVISNDWRNIKKNSKSKLNKIQFLTALDLVLNNLEFSFDSKIYRQIFGTPMGSPISPIIANLVMEDLENTVLNSLDFQPIFYYRYVDDIITAIPSNKVSIFLDAFNSVNSRIKFTLEEESEQKIPFLDILLIREPNGQISCDWYQKPTWSGRYLNFLSWLPTTYKLNTIKILSQKILKLSDTQFHNKNFKLLEHTLVGNQYPKKLVSKVIYKERYFQNDLAIGTNEENPKYLCIPYVKNLFEKIKILFKNYNFKVVGRSTEGLNVTLFSKLKDPLPLKKQSNVVYQIKCGCDVTYTGQTKQFLEKRFYQHKRDVNNLSVENCSALTQHLRDTNHSVFLENFKIVEKQTNFKTRSILEMLHIKSSRNSINIMSDCAYIGNTYDLFV